MSLRRALPWLLLLAACDDDAAIPVDAGPDAGLVDASTVEHFDGGEPLELRDASALGDASAVDAGAPNASGDAGAQDAGEDACSRSASEDACSPGASGDAGSRGTSEDAGGVDCASLGLTYANYGAQFLDLWCLSCHAKMEPYFTTPELVRQWAPAIYLDVVATKRMPPGGNANYLRDEQRRELGRWLNCGAP